MLTLQRKTQIRQQIHDEYCRPPRRVRDQEDMPSLAAPGYDPDDFTPDLRSVDDEDPPGNRDMPHGEMARREHIELLTRFVRQAATVTR